MAILMLSDIKCRNHRIDAKSVINVNFNIYKPCTWCLNYVSMRNLYKTDLNAGVLPTHDYSPFIIEPELCENFSPNIDFDVNCHEDLRNHIEKTSNNWSRITPGKFDHLIGLNLERGQIVYPDGMEAIRFFIAVSNVQLKCQEVLSKLHAHEEIPPRLKNYIDNMILYLAKLAKEIDRIENSTTPFDKPIVSNWSSKSIIENSLWSGLTDILDVIEIIINP